MIIGRQAAGPVGIKLPQTYDIFSDIRHCWTIAKKVAQVSAD